MPRTISAPAASSRSNHHALDCAGSISTRRPFRSPSDASTDAGFSSVTSSPSQPGSSLVTLRGSRNSFAVPLACTIACPSGSGVRITSPPRTLKSQAIDAGAVSTAQSAPFASIAAPIRLRFDAALSPAYRSGCGTTGAVGCDGRASPQARSSGLTSTGFRSAPAFAAERLRTASASGLCSRGS